MAIKYIQHLLLLVSVIGVYANNPQDDLQGTVQNNDRSTEVKVTQSEVVVPSPAVEKGNDRKEQPATASQIADPDPIDEYVNHIIKWVWRKLSPYWYQSRLLRWSTYGLGTVIAANLVIPGKLLNLVALLWNKKNGLGHNVGADAIEGGAKKLNTPEVQKALGNSSITIGEGIVNGILAELSKKEKQKLVNDLTKSLVNELDPKKIGYDIVDGGIERFSKILGNMYKSTKGWVGKKLEYVGPLLNNDHVKLLSLPG
jgi:hypothetical protein